MNIAILEDEALTALFLEETIRDLGHNVVAIFSEGEKLLDFLERESADLLFLDINIKGGLDGIETALNIPNQDIPIVFITSHKDSQTIKRAQKVNTIGYLIKPVDDHHIEAILELSKRFVESTKIKICDDYFFSFDKKLIYQGENPIPIGLKETLCLEKLLRTRVEKTKETYLNKQELIEYIWQDEVGSERDSSLRELISRIKRKFPCISIESLRGFGYRLNLET